MGVVDREPPKGGATTLSSDGAQGVSPAPFEDGHLGFLFTDIDASTEKWERTPGAMAEAQARHEALIDAALAANGGRVRDRVGDSTLGEFASGNPIQAGFELQLALQREAWDDVGGFKVRVAVHCGEGGAPEKEKAAIHRTARILASAWGGQIVVSAAAAGAYAPPPGGKLIDQGFFRLKGIETPMRLFSLWHPDLAQNTFPPLRGGKSYSLSLPAQMAPIFGRAREIEDLLGALEGEARHAVIVGAGGDGKTRLALEVAARISQDTPAYFVALDHVDQSGMLPAAIAAGMHFPLHARDTPEAQLIAYLREKNALLILDNADRLVGQGAFIGEVLRSCPMMRIIVTSREALGFRDERVYRLRGLSAPRVGAPDFSSEPASLLFVREARGHDPAYELRAEDFEEFSAICEYVSGSPLGLQLIAQWASLLSIKEIAALLRSGVGALGTYGAGEARSALDRVFDGSWSLLTPALQDVLMRLGVFPGGFDLEAAQAVAGADLNALAALERKCLVQRRGERRLTIHPLVRDFARARLSDAPGERLLEARLAHRIHYLAMVRRCFSEARGAQQGEQLNRVQDERENIRFAFRDAVGAGDIDSVRDSAEALFYMFVMRAMFRECAEAVKSEGAPAALRPYLDVLRANCLAHLGGLEEAEALASAALRLAAPQSLEWAHAHHVLGNVAHMRGKLAVARTHYCDGLGARENLGDGMGCYYSTASLALLELSAGRTEEARGWIRKETAVCERIGNLGGMMIAFATAGMIAMSEGALAEARESFGKSLKLEAQVRHPQGRAASLRYLGGVCSREGDVEGARRAYCESAEIAHEIGDRRMEADSNLGLGRSLRLSGEGAEARKVLRSAVLAAHEMVISELRADGLCELARVAFGLGNVTEAGQCLALVKAEIAEAVLSEIEHDRAGPLRTAMMRARNDVSVNGFEAELMQLLGGDFGAPNR